jgi:hypothetical protein
MRRGHISWPAVAEELNDVDHDMLFAYSLGDGQGHATTGYIFFYQFRNTVSVGGSDDASLIPLHAGYFVQPRKM